jgi:hypothetical protein
MTTEQRQKRDIALALGIILREKRRLYEKTVSLAGYEFDESGEEEEPSFAWTGAGVYVNAFREPWTPPRPEAGKTAGRRTLLNYRREGGAG